MKWYNYIIITIISIILLFSVNVLSVNSKNEILISFPNLLGFYSFISSDFMTVLVMILFIIFMPLILGYRGKESNTKNITINYKRGNKK